MAPPSGREAGMAGNICGVCEMRVAGDGDSDEARAPITA